MSINSTIAVENPDGTVSQVYCHWDGGLNHNGVILYNHYNDLERAQLLITHGSISILGFHIEPTEAHSFNKPQRGVCVFYGRDRGEPDISPTMFSSFEEYSSAEALHNYTNYTYVLRTTDCDFPTWFVRTPVTANYISLQSALLGETQ